MTFAIIGSGNIGAAVARHFARLDLVVAVATAKGPDAVVGAFYSSRVTTRTPTRRSLS
jgi:predicted dinucleotide-binding enzyme